MVAYGVQGALLAEHSVFQKMRKAEGYAEQIEKYGQRAGTKSVVMQQHFLYIVLQKIYMRCGKLLPPLLSVSSTCCPLYHLLSLEWSIAIKSLYPLVTHHQPLSHSNHTSLRMSWTSLDEGWSAQEVQREHVSEAFPIAIPGTSRKIKIYLVSKNLSCFGLSILNF